MLLKIALPVNDVYGRVYVDYGMCDLYSLAGQTLIIRAKESGETHAKVVSHDGMLSCQSDSL